MLYQDKELVDVLLQFTRARDRRASPNFWAKNLDVMDATIDLFVETGNFLRLLLPFANWIFGLTTHERKKVGIPVVASEVGGLAFLVQDGVTGFTVPVDDPQALADRILKLISNPGLRLQMGQKAAEYAHEYAWENIVRRIKDLYQDILYKQAVVANPPEF